MRRLQDVFTAFGAFAEDAGRDAARIESADRQRHLLEREIDRLRAELDKARRSLETERRAAPNDAAQALTEELSREGGGRLAALARWHELGQEERDALKQTFADIVRDEQVPF